MKLYLLVFLSAILSISCQDSGKYKSTMNMPIPQKNMDSVSYMIGYNMGKSMRNDSIGVSVDYLFQGILKGLKGDSSCLTEKDVQKLQSSFQAAMMKKQDAKMKQQQEAMLVEGKKNKEVGEKFLEENKKIPGIKITESGLQYAILKEGSGKTPEEDDQITFHIKAFKVDGTKFDDSYERGQPVKLGIKGQVPAWKEAFLMMKVGSKIKIFVPPSLGWGEKGAPPQIPPNSVIVFELELLSIDGKISNEKKPASPAQMSPQ